MDERRTAAIVGLMVHQMVGTSPTMTNREHRAHPPSSVSAS
jgi:hypothetical protein